MISPTPAKRTSAPRSETCIYTVVVTRSPPLPLLHLLLFPTPYEGLDALIGITTFNVFF